MFCGDPGTTFIENEVIMALNQIHYGPFSRIGDRYNRFIDPTHFMGRNATAETWIAPANTSEKKGKYNLEVYLPGFKKEEVSVSIIDDMLEVIAKKENQDEKEYLTKEIETNFAQRRFKLPKTVDRDRISAKLQDGILKIKLDSKKEDSSNKVKIV